MKSKTKPTNQGSRKASAGIQGGHGVQAGGGLAADTPPINLPAPEQPQPTLRNPQLLSKLQTMTASFESRFGYLPATETIYQAIESRIENHERAHLASFLEFLTVDDLRDLRAFFYEPTPRPLPSETLPSQPPIEAHDSNPSRRGKAPARS